jgi:hypothetical protein
MDFEITQEQQERVEFWIQEIKRTAFEVKQLVDIGEVKKALDLIKEAQNSLKKFRWEVIQTLNLKEDDIHTLDKNLKDSTEGLEQARKKLERILKY